MVRRSLMAAAMLAVAAPLAAQSVVGPVEWTWSADRPDAEAPLGIFGGRLMDAAQIQVGYRYSQNNWLGVWFGSDSLSLASTRTLYNDAPIQRSEVRHEARLAYGVTEDLTLVANAAWVIMDRETFGRSGRRMFWGVNGVSDVEVGALYSAYRGGPYRLHFQAGGIIPTGASTTYADTTGTGTGAQTPLPYDMRLGGGTPGIVLGMTGSVQNEVASLGGQFRMKAYFGSNGAGTNGYRLGNQYEGNGWASYKLNDVLSISGGARWQSWSALDGNDDRLNPMGDPHNVGRIMAGQRALLPLGLNFVMPAGSRFSGHRLSMEAVYTLHTDYEGPQMGLDWGVNLGYSIGM